VAGAVQFLPCRDLSEDDPTWHAALGMMVGMDSATCEDVADYCGNMTLYGVRALCARTCGCHQPYPARGGFFQTQQWGCPGGCDWLQTDAIQSYPCTDDLDRMNQTGWEAFVDGMREYFFSIDDTPNRILDELSDNNDTFNISQREALIVYQFIVGNGFWDSLAKKNFLLADGIPHPRNLTGCPFLASSEVQTLLQIHFCATDSTFSTLRVVCPISCSCPYNPEGCTSVCDPLWWYVH